MSIANTNLAYTDYQNNYPSELINGQIVLMSPSPATNHGRIIRNLVRHFDAFLQGKTCEVFGDTVDVHLTEKDCFVPDVLVVCDPDKVREDGIYGAPDLVAEVLSPSTAKRDKGYKKDVYEACGVKEYWLISPVEKSLEQYFLTDGRFVLNEVYSIYPDFLLKNMTEEERAAIPTEFKCSLYDDLIIKLEEVFERVK